MSRSRLFIVTLSRLFVLSLALSASAAHAEQKLLLGDVAYDGRQVLFTWSGRLWTTPGSGGEAKLLFPDEVGRGLPFFSSDGSKLAYTNLVDGDIYARNADGSEQRLTFHPKFDMCRGFAPDGKSVIYASSREIDGKLEMYSVTIGNPWETKLPLPSADTGAFGSDPTKLAYVPDSIFATSVNRRFYRGGSLGSLFIVDLPTGKRKLISEKGSNSISPRWIGDTVYYLNDRLASFNLVSHDLNSNKKREYTQFREKGITSMSVFGNDAIFVQDGQLFRCDLKSGSISPIKISLDGATVAKLDERKRKEVPAERFASSFMPSFDGKAVAIEARGEVLVWTKEGVKNLTNDSSSAERVPVVSPDGASVAYFSDASGEYQLVIHRISSGEKIVIPIEKESTFYRELEWSPDGKKLSFSDQRVSLWIADVASRSAKKIDESKHMAQRDWNPDWSPDSRWLAYAKAMPSRVRSVILYDTQTGRTGSVTTELAHAEFPVFDKSGRYLYFSASSNARNAMAHDIGWALMSDFQNRILTAKVLCAAVLSKSEVAPLHPIAATPSVALAEFLSRVSTQVDLDGLSGRVVPLSLGERDIQDLEAGVAGTVFVQHRVSGETPGTYAGGRSSLIRYSLLKPSVAEKIADTMQAFEISGDGRGLLMFTREGVSLQDATAPLSEGALPSTKIALTGAVINVDLAEEWRQMYNESWRMMRDYFYDPNHHGQDARALHRHYAQYLPMIVRRSDLNALLSRGFGEISVSHLQVGGGDITPSAVRPSTPPAALLGADYVVKNGRFSFGKIYKSGDYLSDNVLLRAPLDQPGVTVTPGEYLIEIDGQNVTPDKSIHSYLQGKAHRPVKIRVGTDPSGAGAREYTVVPLSGENGLRRANWFSDNREKVAKMSGGKLAYAYIENHDRMGFYDLMRVLNSSQHTEGLVIDERFNGGGITADVQIDALLRRPILAYDYRHGGEIVFPSSRIDGPKVLITNQANGSAAETFAMMFKAAGVGKTVGWETFGGGIGVALFQQPLVDNGTIGIPNRAGYNPLSGRWEIENEGVPVDVRVEVTPEDYLRGRDPQLEAAVRVALEDLKKYRKPALKKPKPPVHGG